MYVGVDIGGTKTLAVVLDEQGTVVEQAKFPTPQNYDDFISELAKKVAGFKIQDFKAGGVAVPGHLDRHRGIVLGLGNLPWKNEPIQADCEKALGCPIVIENDANLAALSEANLHPEYETVLYVTISTGIGTGVVYKGSLDPALLDGEGGHVQLPYKGKLVSWEKFASGKAIYEHFGKKAADIHDETDWKYIVRNISLGLFENIAIVQPDLIIIGGSIGTYFDRYGKLLEAELRKYDVPVVSIPKIVQAKRPEEAVVYGCYHLAKQTFDHANTNK